MASRVPRRVYSVRVAQSDQLPDSGRYGNRTRDGDDSEWDFVGDDGVDSGKRRLT
jgi:hypothetical protein